MPDRNSLFTEVGRTGLTRFGGTIAEEWLRELRGSRGVKIYKEMRDNDAIVGAFLYAVEMLLRQVTWRVEKGGETPADEEAADFLEGCLYDMAGSWQDTLSEILSMLPFGWSYMEIVYKKRLGPDMKDGTRRSKYTDGRIGWRKWSLRAQETLYEWEYADESDEKLITDNDDGLLGMKQQPPPDYVLRFIPIEKALLFRPSVTKGNPEGRSILRNAYRSWYMKKNIEEVEAIGIERDLAGLPVVWLPETIIKRDGEDAITAYNDWKKIVQNIRRDEQEGIMMPLCYDENNNKLYDLTLLSTGSRRQFDTNAIIARYDQRMAMTVMADFLLLGHENVGSFALSSDKTSLFAIALGTILDSIADVINTKAVPRLFALNDFGDLTDLPKFVHDDVESPDLEALGSYIERLSGAAMPLFPDDGLEEYLRSAAHLPAKPEDPSVAPKVQTGGAADDQKLEKLEKRYYQEREEFLGAVRDLRASVQKAMEDDEDDDDEDPKR